MRFETREEAYQHFVRYASLPKETKLPDYWMNYKDKPKMGDWLLFRHICNEKEISEPILALVIGHTIWDQALVLEYVTEWRTWEANTEYNCNPKYNLYVSLSFIDKETKQIQFWTDDIQVLGHWKIKPNFKQLLKSYRNAKTTLALSHSNS